MTWSAVEIVVAGIGAVIALVILAFIGAAIVQVPLALFGGML